MRELIERMIEELKQQDEIHDVDLFSDLCIFLEVFGELLPDK